MTPVVVLCTAPNAEVGADLAKGLVERRLAACVNVISGVRSFYRWEGKVAVDDEVQLVIKTTESRAEAIEAYLQSAHPYDVPEVLR
ncbi:MAG: divalent-cation tolerance protein CutA, partial [Myxococcota bacterium]